MTRSKVSLIVGLIGLFAAGLGCGTSNSNRVLKSITVTPRSAVANGQQVQFTATGTFSQPPSPAPVPFVAPYSGSWQSSDLAIATIDQNGVARCNGNKAGTTNVIAQASANSCTMMGCMSVSVSGTATLTCP